ncbi:hypothetical protein GCM10023149_23340 [Mucilaginibacter gynuensis]|uniref:Uncharacterized protein n=1 Tax=Mucilaginibacter gynuensis TaxID=1302236 RepID=A0ABP8GEA8_9SPHI
MNPCKWLPLLCLIILISCSKKKDVDIENKWSGTPVISEISKALTNNPINTDSATVQDATGGSVVNDNISVYIPPHAFTLANGTAINGSALVKLETITTVKDMVLSGITTISNKGLLESGGMIRISAYDNKGNPLKVNKEISLVSNFPVSNFTFGFPSAFKGTPTANNNANKITWALWGTISPDGIPTGPVVMPPTNNTPDRGISIVNIDEIFTWTNLDAYITSTSPLTDITVTLPNGFSNLNTQCCFNYAGINSCAYLSANAALKVFTTNGSGYKVIRGRAANIIVMAKKNGTYYIQVIAVKAIGDNQTINADNLKETTMNGIKLILAGL